MVIPLSIHLLLFLKSFQLYGVEFVVYFFCFMSYRSDVLGQFMPLVGVDWSQTGVAHLFSAVKVCLCCPCILHVMRLLQCDNVVNS